MVDDGPADSCIAVGGAALIAGLALGFAGYVPNVEQSALVQNVMLGLLGILPGTCYVIGTVIFLRFSLNESEHAAIVGELAARRRGQFSAEA